MTQMNLPTPDDQLAIAMKADCWKESYIKDLLGHMRGLRKFGVSELLSQSLVQDTGYLLVAENGKAKGSQFGTLRGHKSAVDLYEQYMSKQYDDADEIIDLVVAYAKGVRISSWDPVVQVVKAFLAQERTAPQPGAYFWKSVSDDPQTWKQAKDSIDIYRNKLLGTEFNPDRLAKRDAKLRNAIISWHAFTQELLTHTMFPGNDSKNRTVTVVRTESSAACKHFYHQDKQLNDDQIENLDKLYGQPLTAVRGVLESSSMYTVKTIFGNVVTEYRVPYHRVFALYLTAQPKSKAHMLSFFENDSENELSFMPEGLSFQLKKPEDLAFAAPPKKVESLHW